MSRTLIISEKADAGRRIAYFLSDGKSKQKRSKGLNFIEYDDEENGFFLVPLSGHIVELDFPKNLKDWKMETLQDLIDSSLIHNVKNKTAHESLTEIASRVDSVIVATDYDREGELIGTEALDIIKNKAKFNGRIYRAKFSALTGREIREAFSNFIDVDYRLANSAGAREEIDLYWGAVLTRFFSLITKRLGKNFLSIGRVQTPTLAIIVKREEEIEKFIPEKYWEIKVDFFKDHIFTGTNEEGRIFDREKIEKIFEKIKGHNGRVLYFEKKEERIYKPSPFNTTEFMREASRIGIMPGRAMKIAESLYVRGYISYPRTDNTVYQKSINLKAVVEKLKKGELARESEMVLSQENIYPSRGKMEATDHPPIYPTEVVLKKDLRNDEWKIYELIARRFLATLYREGKRDVRESVIEINGENFKTHGSIVTDPGWLEIYTYRKANDVFHPDLVVGEDVEAKDWRIEEGETKPPARYDMASLIKEMERLNLGTKSTRHDIIEKLQSRGFIEGNPVKPTALGKALIEGVMSVDSKIAESQMTAELETFMDNIAAGEKTRDQVVEISRNMLRNVLMDLEKNKDEISKIIRNALETGTQIAVCPEHGTPIQAVKIRDSIRFRCETEGCKIDYYHKLRGLIKESESKCPVCGLPLVTVIRRGQSPEIICINPQCEYNSNKRSAGKCPADGGDLIIRQSRYGKRFLGCSNFPKCKQTYPLPQKGEIRQSGKTCQFCGAPILIVENGKYSKEFCPKINCEFNEKNKKKEDNEGKAEQTKKRVVKKKTTTRKGTGGKKVAKKTSV
ncbi:DNA topoisomerase I [Cuniculiplasma sp. SKW4]|uniref:DNA topoisomerase I n=1 Tax=Cuniculiplasma sp. SKW4 TaxID=3400171 RepID=UPI003FD2C32E